MIFRKIDQQIQANQLLQDIDRLINTIQTEDRSKKLLVISIKDIATENTDLIPKLEYKND